MWMCSQAVVEISTTGLGFVQSPSFHFLSSSPCSLFPLPFEHSLSGIKRLLPVFLLLLPSFHLLRNFTLWDLKPLSLNHIPLNLPSFLFSPLLWHEMKCQSDAKWEIWISKCVCVFTSGRRCTTCVGFCISPFPFISPGGVHGSVPGRESLSQEQLEHPWRLPRVRVPHWHRGVDGRRRQDPRRSPCSQVAQDATPPQVRSRFLLTHNQFNCWVKK